MAALVILGLTVFAACRPPLEPRIYTAPKDATVFVVPPPKQAGSQIRKGGMPPMSATNSTPLKERRILGAIFPLNGWAYFLKITDTIARVEKAKEPFQDVVAQFQADPETFVPSFPLPEGWTMGAGDSIADAKVQIAIPDDDKPVIMTITKLSAPQNESEWYDYLKAQLDRWNDQVGHQHQSIEEIRSNLVSIERPNSSIPAFVFDKDGSHVAGLSLGPTESSNVSPTPAPRGELKLIYDTPEGWKAMPNRPPRLAHFQVGDPSLNSEIIISQAIDLPLDNCKMWAQQILKTDDTAKVDTKAQQAVDSAETVPAGNTQAKVYRLAASDSPDSNCLIIASIPIDDKGQSLFVKFRTTTQIAQEQNANLLRFIASMRWE